MLISVIFFILSVLWAIFGTLLGTKPKRVYNPRTRNFEYW